MRVAPAPRAVQRLDASAVWKAAPHGASLCTEIPANWQGLAQLAGPLGEDKEAVARLAARFDGPGAVCWYPGSRLYTPLFLAHLDALPDADARRQFGRLFAAAVGHGQAQDATPDADGTLRWQARVGSVHGATERGPDGATGFTVGLALREHLLAFSADPELVQLALGWPPAAIRRSPTACPPRSAPSR